MNKENKIYVIVEESIWDFQPKLNVISASTDYNVAKKIYNDRLSSLKNRIGFDDMDAMEESDENMDEYGYIYYETEDNFYLYLNRETFEQHISIYLQPAPLVKELQTRLEI